MSPFGDTEEGRQNRRREICAAIKRRAIRSDIAAECRIAFEKVGTVDARVRAAADLHQRSCDRRDELGRDIKRLRRSDPGEVKALYAQLDQAYDTVRLTAWLLNAAVGRAEFGREQGVDWVDHWSTSDTSDLSDPGEPPRRPHGDARMYLAWHAKAPRGVIRRKDARRLNGWITRQWTWFPGAPHMVMLAGTLSRHPEADISRPEAALYAIASVQLPAFVRELPSLRPPTVIDAAERLSVAPEMVRPSTECERTHIASVEATDAAIFEVVMGQARDTTALQACVARERLTLDAFMQDIAGESQPVLRAPPIQ